jgi:organic hydroperoxide reductase OsmC/OhrA
METMEKVMRVRLALDHGYQFVATYPDSPAAGPVVLDEPRPLGEGTGPNPAALLATAVANCLASSLLFCLRKARVQPDGLTAVAEAHMVRNDAGRYRIDRVDVELCPGVDDAELGGLARCERLFEDYCIVTESVRHGIDVNVSVCPRVPAAIAR